jgi:hypothetical protein
MDNITPPQFNRKKTQGNVNQTGNIESIQLSHLGKTIDIDPALISEACAQAAKQAYDLGETNDEDEYKKDMEEVITSVLNKKRKKKR